MSVKVRTFEQLALEEPTEKWELDCGRVRKKPPMTMEHYDLAFELAYTIRSQVSHDAFHVRCDQGRLVSKQSYLVPDVFVVSANEALRFRGRDETLEAYDRPVPFVAEIWSRSTGDYDVTEKLARYHERGDAEIWLIHPYDRTVAIHRRRTDSSYATSQAVEGTVQLAAVPVSINLTALFGRFGGG